MSREEDARYNEQRDREAAERRREEAAWADAAHERTMFQRNLCGCGLGTRVVGTMCSTELQIHRAAQAAAEGATPSVPLRDLAETISSAERSAPPPPPPYLDPRADMTDEGRALELAAAQDRLEQTPVMDRLWDRAALGCDDEQLRAARLWMLVNEGTGADSLAARAYLRHAGYELGSGSEPPRLSDLATRLTPEPVTPVQEVPVVTGCSGCGGYLTSVGSLCLACAMRAAEASEHDPGESGRVEDRRLRIREDANRCMNLCGPAVVGRLCTACMAQLRAQEAAMEHYQAAYARAFDETPDLAALWHRASHDRKGKARSFKRSREHFWTLVSSDPGPEARFVRTMLQAGGFDQKPGRSPQLKLHTGAKKTGRDRADRLLTIDHISPQAHDRGSTIDAANLRFMIGRDNSQRGHYFTAADEPLVGWQEFWRARSLRR